MREIQCVVLCLMVAANPAAAETTIIESEDGQIRIEIIGDPSQYSQDLIDQNGVQDVEIKGPEEVEKPEEVQEEFIQYEDFIEDDDFFIEDKDGFQEESFEQQEEEFEEEEEIDQEDSLPVEIPMEILKELQDMEYQMRRIEEEGMIMDNRA